MFYFKYCVLFFHTFLFPIQCETMFGSLNDLRTSGNGTETSTEFVYGNCRPSKSNPLEFFAHVHLTYESIKKTAIARGWLDIPREPTCIRVRGTFYEEDMFRTTAYNFQMCTPVITYIHSRTRYRYFHYEWYLTDEELPGVDWDLYFYGPPGKLWGYTKWSQYN